MSIAEVRGIDRFVDALKTGLVDVETSWHDACYDNVTFRSSSMAKTLIRDALSSDFPALLRIDQGSFPPGIAFDSAELAYFMDRQGAETIVLEADAEIAAFLLMEIVNRRKSATLITLDVCKEHRRRGYATALLARSEEVLRKRGIQSYELQVDVQNVAAIAFYEKHGFEKIRVLRRYYPNGNDAYFMVKRLERT